MCILLETYWERMNLKIPIYFAVGLTEKVTSKSNIFVSISVCIYMYVNYSVIQYCNFFSFRLLHFIKCLSLGQTKR